MLRTSCLLASLVALTIPRLEAVTLKETGIVFPDGTEQTTAALSEVQNFFLANETVTINDGSVGRGGVAILEVPEGYRALVEYVSVFCYTPIGNTVTRTVLSPKKRVSPTSTTSVSFQVPIRYQGSAGSSYYYVGGLTTRLYADRGTEGISVTASAYRADSTGFTDCSFSLSGRYLPVPESELAASSPAPERRETVEVIVPFFEGGDGDDTLDALDGAIWIVAPPDERR